MDYRVFPSTKIYLDNSPVHGKGVFASDTIEKDEVFEECYILSLPIENGKDEYTQFEIDLFKDYRFNWPHGMGWEEQVLPTGFGCFYNHSQNPNAFWRSNIEKRTFEFVAYRKIEPGEEIFIWYGDIGYFKSEGRTLIPLDEINEQE